MQDVLIDPIRLLQQSIEDQAAQGCSFDGTVLNIATRSTIDFLTEPNRPLGSSVAVEVPDGGGSVGNIRFLDGNAEVALVYATFWIERVAYPGRPPYMQLQYAQMTLLDFPVRNNKQNFSWPHVSVATLRKSFA
jgi:hypothetical protein